ncbi:MAG: glycosyltransferase [Clostridia bacterium]|nr:glycosyltransferase [Clostridia bacterium]
MNINHRLNQIKYYFARYGFFETVKKCIKRILGIKDNPVYTDNELYKMWIANNEPSEEELEKLKSISFEKEPLISVVVPMYNTNERYFEELVTAMENQIYKRWELCLADGSNEKNPKFEEMASKDNRIFYKFLGENKGISGNSNEALKMANGKYIALLDHDDLLPVNSLFEFVKTINENNEPDFIYSDEDKINDNGERYNPYFKPDYSPETLAVHNYITHLIMFKKELLEKVGMFDDGFNGAQDYDLILRLTENSKNIIHISKILYHWRAAEGSTADVADNKPYAFEAGRRAVEAHIKRLGLEGKVENGQDIPGVYKINYEVIGNPKVSILIPNKDGLKYLKPCIKSILKLTTYENYEIVIIENNSEKPSTFKYYEKIKKNPKIKVLEYKEKEFNYSRIINFGVKNVDGDFVMQLNNDTKLITKNWLEQFIGYAQQNDIGAVGARLYYKDKSIQHAGIAIGIAGTAGALLVNLEYGKHAYYGFEAITRNVSAVTGACLFSKRSIYEEVRIYGRKQV